MEWGAEEREGGGLVGGEGWLERRSGGRRNEIYIYIYIYRERERDGKEEKRAVEIRAE